jgi:hypothetical protein
MPWVDDRPDARIAAVAARQHGLVTVAQARAAGLSDAAIRSRVTTARWERVRPKVFRVAGAVATPEQRVLAACLHLGPGALASHESAAWLWGLDGFERPPSRVHVTVAGDTGRRRERDVDVHRTRLATPADRGERRGIPVTSVARTLVDLGTTCSLRRVEGARDAAHREGHLSLRREAAQMRRMARLPGAGVMRALIAADAGGPPAESILERDVLHALAATAVPPPVRQHHVEFEGARYRLDAAWPDQRVGLEAHSIRFHSGHEAWFGDVSRLGDVGGAGWIVVVATKRDVRDRGRRLTRQLLGALRSRGVERI